MRHRGWPRPKRSPTPRGNTPMRMRRKRSLCFARLWAVSSAISPWTSWRGAACIAGGFLSSMFDLLQRSEFATRFLHGRSIRVFLEHVSVRVMEHGRHGVLGAARYYVDRLGVDRMARERVTE